MLHFCKHIFVFDLFALFYELFIAAARTLLGGSGEENLDLRVGQNNGTDIASVHDAVVFGGDILLETEKELADCGHRRDFRGRH